MHSFFLILEVSSYKEKIKIKITDLCLYPIQKSHRKIKISAQFSPYVHSLATFRKTMEFVPQKLIS